VTFELTNDRPRRKRGEVNTPTRVEAVNRLHQRDGGDLHEVVEWLATVEEATGQLMGESEIGGDQLLTLSWVEGRVVSSGVGFRPGI
jgi:hypothetical protein